MAELEIQRCPECEEMQKSHRNYCVWCGFYKEEYEYGDDKLVVRVTKFFYIGAKENTIIDKYIFDLENQYLKTYIVEEYDVQGNRKKSYWDGHVFDVNVIRKI